MASGSALCLSRHVVQFLDFRDIHIARAVSWEWYSVYGSREVEKQCLRSYGVPREYRFRFWLSCSQAHALVQQTSKSSSDYGFVASDINGRRNGASKPDNFPSSVVLAYRAALAKSRFKVEGDGGESEMSWFKLSQRPGMEGEIARDVTRTFAQRPLFRVKHGLGRRMLFNILVALAVREPKVGYCQGMNFVVAVIIVVALRLERGYSNADDGYEARLTTQGLPENEQESIEADIFALMIAFLNRFDMRELWRPGVPQLKLRIFQFDRLISSKLPAMHSHFREIGLAPDFFASQWFLTLMSYNIDMQQLVRVWDVLLVEGWKTIFRAGLAVLGNWDKKVISMSLEELSMFFRLGDTTAVNKSSSVAVPLSIDANFFALKISTRELADLESEFITHVIFKEREQQERIRAEQVGYLSSARRDDISEADEVASLASRDDVFVDHRLAAAYKEEIELLDTDTRNDFAYLRGRIEEVERDLGEKNLEFQQAAKEYIETKTILDELRNHKKQLSNELYELTKSPNLKRGDHEYQAYLDRIETVSARVTVVEKTFDASKWRFSQAQAEVEDIAEKKLAFSHQLRSVLEQSESVKSQTLKSLWASLEQS